MSSIEMMVIETLIWHELVYQQPLLTYVTPRILQLNFFFSLLAKIRALPFPFLFPLAKP
jgi:hypothetical protein